MVKSLMSRRAKMSFNKFLSWISFAEGYEGSYLLPKW